VNSINFRGALSGTTKHHHHQLRFNRLKNHCREEHKDQINLYQPQIEKCTRIFLSKQMPLEMPLNAMQMARKNTLRIGAH